MTHTTTPVIGNSHGDTEARRGQKKNNRVHMDDASAAPADSGDLKRLLAGLSEGLTEEDLKRF